MSLKPDIDRLAILLVEKLRGMPSFQGIRYVTAEALASELGEERADIQRAMVLLGRRGWSFRPSNGLPYARRYGLIRSRKKGETYEHDSAEPDWARTSYEVREPSVG